GREPGPRRRVRRRGDAWGAPGRTGGRHLLRNLGDVAERVLVGLSLPPIRVEQTEPAAKRPLATKPKDRETRKDAERRQALYDEIHDLYAKTKSIRTVADRLGIDRRTVRKYLNAPECPQPKP